MTAGNRPSESLSPSGAPPSWHCKPAAAIAAELKVDLTAGLSTVEAGARLSQAGPNELIDHGTKSPWRILWEQLTAVMVLILIAAAGLSLVLGKYLEAAAILAIVLLFAVLGFVQEYRAERAIAALKKLAVPNVRVRRDGAVQEISARELAPGDVVLLEAGNVVPADLRIVDSASLRIQEAALTGESEPVEKVIDPIDREDVPLGDRRNMGYLGTVVTYGRGAGLVVETGMRTELGRIAALLQSVKAEMTPLQQRLDQVGKLLAVGGVVVALIILGLGLWAGESLQEMLLTAIGVAVAVIPEGLPAVVTFTLAIGAQRMLRRNALVRKLPAVETLGSVTTICSDKTGTLTENRMTVTVLDVVGHRLDLDETLSQGMPSLHGEQRDTSAWVGQPAAIRVLLAGGALNNDALLQTMNPETGAAHTVGDPTEAALLVAAARAGFDKTLLEASHPRVAELPFDSDRKRMTTVHRSSAGDATPLLAALHPLTAGYGYLAITKGAVDGLLDLSTRVWIDDAAAPLDEELRTRVEAANERLAGNGMRVLGIAVRPLAEPTAADVERDLVFVGLVGMIDPPRPEVRAAVQTCTQAGIRPVMITGDHPLTAGYIARSLGITGDERVLTGADLNRMDDRELEASVQDISVFARVSPEHKLRIVDALQRQGQVVAMTGDGVNDAPALKKADIGVAMGITGTDVSKEAADMVLRDDNFATIVAAVEEGRVIYDNLRRFIKFAVAGNIGKVAVMLLWPLPFLFLGMEMADAVALLPLQLLWLNLMTDGLLGLSMGFEPAEKTVMNRPPHSPSAGLFHGGLAAQTIWNGLLIGAIALTVGFWYDSRGLPQWQTMIFTTLAFLQVFQALATRSNRESLFQQGLFSNRMMVGMVVLVVALQLAALYLPLLQEEFLDLVPLGRRDLLIAVGLGALLFVVIEIEKFFRRRQAPAPTTPLPPQVQLSR